MLLSIIIVTFNAAGSIRGTLDSIASQTSRDFECVVVDGASTDDTVAVAESYAGPIAALRIVSQPDKGLYDAMNKGIALSQSSYVLFLNAGDIFHDERVVADFERLIAEGPQLPTMVYGHTLVVTHDGMKFVRKVRRLGYIGHGQPTIHQSVFFRRDRHLDHLYPFDLYPISSDYASMAAIQQSDPGGVLTWDRIVSDFHNDPQGVSNRNFRQRVLDAWRIQRDILGVSALRRIYSVFRRTAASVFYNFRPR